MSDEAAKSGAMQMLARAGSAVRALPPGKQGLLAVAAAAALALGVVGWWWSGRVEWKPLYNGLEARDVAQVESELGAAGITYQPTPDGSGVQVPATLLDKARIAVASKGAPASGRMGFELFDKPNWIGSDFDDKVNYQRALEGELEHTIASMGAVRSARVHLVLPKESLFAAEQQPAKASVVLRLRGTGFNREQIDAVRALVSGAVDGLAAENVTLVDADGRLDMTRGTAQRQEGDEEAQMETKLVAMLEPLAGAGNVRATVRLTRDESTQDRVDEVVDPAQTATLTSERREETTGTGAPRTPVAAGVPGTASNTVSATAVGTSGAPLAHPELPVFPSAAAGANTAREEQNTYAVTRHTLHAESLPGRITRVSAAVVVNDRAQPAAGGDMRTVWTPRSADEMRRFTQLAQAAVGFDTARGDTVAVENIAFDAQQTQPAPGKWAAAREGVATLLRAQPGLLRTLGALLLAVLALFAVVRPAGRELVTILREAPALPAPGAAATLAAVPVVSAAPEPAMIAPAPRMPELPLRQAAAAIDTEGVLEYVTDHLRRAPEQGSRLLGAWIGTRDEVRS